MSDTVVIALPSFASEAERIARYLNADMRSYSRTVFSETFSAYPRIVAVMAAGIAVRGIAPLLRDKWADPAVVVVSPDLKYAVPVLGGHHGANELARQLAGLGMVSVITTATETKGRDAVEKVAEMTGTSVANRDSTRNVNAAILEDRAWVYRVNGPGIVIAGQGVSFLVRDGVYAVGIGCRKGVGKEEVIRAVEEALSGAGIAKDEVFIYATTAKKSHETGLFEAITALSANLILLDDETINAQRVISPSRARRLGIQGVAEPSALAASKRREIVMEKKVIGRVTVAIAR
jgi:cobalt-precorrin 5A hydrolase